MRKERECALTSNFLFFFGESRLQHSITASNKLDHYRLRLTKNGLNHQFSVPNKIQRPPFSFSKGRHTLEPFFKGHPQDQGKCPLSRCVPYMEVRLGFVNEPTMKIFFLLFCVRICCSHYFKPLDNV